MSKNENKKITYKHDVSVELTFPVERAFMEVDFNKRLMLTVKTPIPVILEEIGLSDIINETGVESILSMISIRDVIHYYTPEELMDSIPEDPANDYLQIDQFTHISFSLTYTGAAFGWAIINLQR